MENTVRAVLEKNSPPNRRPKTSVLPDLGQRIREIRHKMGLKQTELASRSGVSHSALSKIENNQLSPTFETLLRIVEGLNVDISVLLGGARDTKYHTRRAITRHGQGSIYETGNYMYEVLCEEILNKRMIPILTRIKAHTIEEFGDLMRHPGEEVVYVVEGEIELHTDHYAPVRLKTGDCAYFDSTMGHALVSAHEKDALILWVATPE